MIYILILAIIVFVLDVRQTRWNSTITGNGLGSVELVLAGKAFLPSQHRVLVPWLSGCANGYQITKGLGVLVAFGAMHLYYGAIGAPVVLCLSLTALFLVLAQIFDYADVYWEIAFFAFAFWLLTVQPLWWPVYLSIVVCLATLNRETAIFIPIAVILSGFYWEAVFPILGFLVGYIIPRWKYGNGIGKYLNPRTGGIMPSLMVFENLQRIKKLSGEDIWFSTNPYGHFFILVALMVWAATLAITSIHLTALLMFCALLVPAIWAEIRVFAVPVMVMMPVLVGG